MAEHAVLAPVIAHRGASADAPENTLAALRLAADHGVRVVEVDVAISADGVAYLHHDDELERCTDGVGRLCDLPSEDIDRLNAGILHSGADREPHRKTFREPLPRLTAAIELLRERRLGLNLEIKPVAGLEERTSIAICEIIEGHWPDDLNLVFSSFSTQALSITRSRLPAVPRALISDAVPEALEELVMRLGLSNLHCDAELIDPTGLATLRSRRLGVYCYTVNDVDQALRLLDFGVDGIFTDHPSRMLQALAPAIR